MSKLGYVAIDQYGQNYKIKKSPRKELLEQLGATHADKMYNDDRDGNAKHTGYGSSKEFDVVYGLGRALYPKGYKHTTRNCHSNDHANGYDRDWHTDGGYRFKQRSI